MIVYASSKVLSSSYNSLLLMLQSPGQKSFGILSGLPAGLVFLVWAQEAVEQGQDLASTNS